MKYDPRIHHRRSIRLQGYAYSQAGAYFVTICTHDRALFLQTNAVQNIVQSTWDALPIRFAHVFRDEFVVMPNHVHAVVIFNEPGGEARREVPGLQAVVGAFKSMSAIAANRVLGRSGMPFWQRNYYEHVIRSEEKLNQIRQYIRDNPAKWAEDPNNPENIRRQTLRLRGVVHEQALGRGKPTPLPK